MSRHTRHASVASDEFRFPTNAISPGDHFAAGQTKGGSATTTRGGRSSGRKTTARGGGPDGAGTKSAATRARSHVRQSSKAGASNAHPGQEAPGATPPPTERTRRGPGGGPREVGRAQAAAGRARGQAPKLAK